MTFDEFEDAVARGAPLPANTPGLLRALWHDATGDWDGAHRLAQEVESAEGAWVHAFLHRKEGDIGNAQYWYRRAGRPPATGTLEDERRAIARALTTTSGAPPPRSR
jgi:hypothetical protein